MFKKIIIIFCLFSLIISANAVQWFDLGKTSNKNMQTFIDLETIDDYKMNSFSKKNYKSAFVQYTYINNHEYRKKGLYYTKEFVVADCDKNLLGTVARIDYGFRNQILDSQDKKYFSDSDLKIVFPETIGQNIVTSICKNPFLIYDWRL